MPRKAKNARPKTGVRGVKPRIRKFEGVHTCRWPGCKKLTDRKYWGCHLHTSTLPLDLRGLMATAWKGKDESYKANVEKRILEWIERQHPSNYPPGVFLSKK